MASGKRPILVEIWAAKRMTDQVLTTCPIFHLAQSSQLNIEMRDGAISHDLSILETWTTGSPFLNKSETDDEEQFYGL